MAQVIIDVPNAIATRVLDKASVYWGWRPEMAQGENPITKAQFVKAHIAAYIKDAVKQQEAAEAAVIARNVSDSEISIT